MQPFVTKLRQSRISLRPLGCAPVLRFVLIMSGLLFIEGFVLSTAQAAVPTDPGVPDLSTRASARTWHNTWWPQTYGAPMGYTGNVEAGIPGDVSADFRNQALLRYNMFRRMVGTKPFTLDAAKNQRAQLAAMFIAANNTAQHGGWPTSAKFYSTEADYATQQCLLALGWNDSEVGLGYMYDYGEANVGAVGHRAGLLSAWMNTTVGIGNVPAMATSDKAEAFALDASVNTDFDPDGFVAWPCAGYMPHYLRTGQWCIDIPDKTSTVKWSFKAATITVLRNGEPMPITGGARNGSDGMVFTIDGTQAGQTGYRYYQLSTGEYVTGTPNSALDIVYHVRIDGIRKRVTPPDDPGAPDLGGGELYMGTGRYEYDVIAYNPDRSSTLLTKVQPVSQQVQAGKSALLEVEAEGVTSYQWYHEWTPIAGATQPWLSISDFEAGKAGKYVCLMQGPDGAMLSKYATLSLANAEADTFVNVSTRATVGAGDNVLVAGFIIEGTEPKQVLIRGAGPALTGLIAQAHLPDPFLKLFNRSQKVIATNDNWCEDATRTPVLEAAMAQTRAFSWARDGKDAALFVTLQPGLYTAQVSSKDGASGVGLVEVYEVGTTGATRMINMSGRSLNSIADEPAVAGFILRGTVKRKVLIRAAGPALHGMIAGELADPVLTVFNESRLPIATNDDWSGDTGQADALEAAMTQTKAFAWTRGSKDAAVLLELEPGLYTAHAKGKDGATGIGLIEVYEVP